MTSYSVPAKSVRALPVDLEAHLLMSCLSESARQWIAGQRALSGAKALNPDVDLLQTQLDAVREALYRSTPAYRELLSSVSRALDACTAWVQGDELRQGFVDTLKKLHWRVECLEYEHSLRGTVFILLWTVGASICMVGVMGTLFWLAQVLGLL